MGSAIKGKQNGCTRLAPSAWPSNVGMKIVERRLRMTSGSCQLIKASRYTTDGVLILSTNRANMCYAMCIIYENFKTFMSKPTKLGPRRWWTFFWRQQTPEVKNAIRNRRKKRNHVDVLSKPPEHNLCFVIFDSSNPPNLTTIKRNEISARLKSNTKSAAPSAMRIVQITITSYV